MARFNALVDRIKGDFTSIIKLLFILATVVFLWGVIRYLSAAGDEEKLKDGKRLILYGIITLFLMVAVWGVVIALANTFGVGTTTFHGIQVPP